MRPRHPNTSFRTGADNHTPADSRTIVERWKTLVQAVKSVLITGGSRGIGRAAALAAASRGWSVTITYVKDAASAQRTAQEIRDRGGRSMVVRGDLRSESDVAGMFEVSLGEFGRIDGVVLNAGTVAPAMPLSDMTVARMRETFEVNVLGVFMCARLAARHVARPGGSVVIVSSVAARLGSAGEYIDYAGSKAAQDALTIGLSKELGPQGIRVNSVRPGVIETEIHAQSGRRDRATRLGATTPLGRSGLPEEVGEAIVWLLSDSSSYVSGALLDVAGGR